MSESTTPLTLDEAVAIFESLPEELLRKAEFLLDALIQDEQAELEVGDE